MPELRDRLPGAWGKGAVMDAANESAWPAATLSGLFVGRREELAQLGDALRLALQGRGQLVLIAGPAGIGKTRTALELAAQAERLQATVLWGRCLEEPGAPPYWPWIQIIRAHVGERGAGTDVDIGPFKQIAALLPEAAAATGVGAAPANHTGSPQARFQLFDAVVRLLLHAARAQPLVLIFDDLHNADLSSLRLLTFLAAQLGTGRLLVLGSYRDDELTRQHPLTETLAELARAPAFRRLKLQGFSHRETEQFMAGASGSAPSDRWVRAIHERTEGHPLFLGETVRFMMEAQAQAQASPWHAGAEHLLTTVPSGVREVIGKRLNRLSVSAGRLLGMAACIGRSFDLGLLSLLDADKSEDEVLAALEEALASRLIEPLPQTGHCRFSHALIRETLYDEMLAVRRVKLHQRIGELLEQRRAADPAPHLPQLAYHFGEAAASGAAAKALDYAQRAAEQSARSLAHEESVRLYRVALRLQQEHFSTDAARRCAMLLALGQVQYTLGAGDASREAFDEAAETARALGFASAFARAATGFEMASVLASRSGERAMSLLQEALQLCPADDAVRVELLASLCRACVYCDRLPEAIDAHDRAVALARQVGDARGLYFALASITSAGYWPELLQQRLLAAREAWHIAETSLGMRWTLAELIAFYLCDLIRAGDMQALRTVLAADRRISQQAGSLYHEAMNFCTETVVAINEGRFADAEALAVQALQTGRRVAENLAVGAYGMQMFCLRREQGRLGEVLPMLQHFVRSTPSDQTWRPGLALLYAELDMRAECLAAYDSLAWSQTETLPKDAGSITVIAFAAEVCAYLGDASRAALLYRLLRPHAGSNLLADLSGPCLGSADRLLGKLAAVLEQWHVAQQHFEAALAMDGHTGARVWLAHSRYGYALMLQRRGHAADLALARGLLDQALTESMALGMNALIPRITAALHAIAAPKPEFPCGLTQREVDVLRLIAIGRNNRDVAQVLAISVNTVANHVRSILEKTYTANRTEAAAFANRSGLLPG